MFVTAILQSSVRRQPTPWCRRPRFCIYMTATGSLSPRATSNFKRVEVNPGQHVAGRQAGNSLRYPAGPAGGLERSSTGRHAGGAMIRQSYRFCAAESFFGFGVAQSCCLRGASFHSIDYPSRHIQTLRITMSTSSRSGLASPPNRLSNR